MKRVFIIALSFIVSFSMIYPATIGNAYAGSSQPKRVINVVYDDSQSMILSGKDTWCKAKYSMEVFAAMLGEKDTMNIYCMSSFDRGKNGGRTLHLMGKDGSKENVDKIHSMLTNAANTPWGTVKKALRDLEGEKADEKWLLILTDGAFETDTPGKYVSQSEVNNTLESKGKKTNVMYLQMGQLSEKEKKKAAIIKKNSDKNIYSVIAKDSSEVLSKVITVSNQIENANTIDVSENSISPDIPLKELVVFCQGKDVSIGGIKGNDKQIKSDEVVTVSYSKKAAKNQKEVLSYKENKGKKLNIDTGLVGKVATFKGDFDSGTYKLDISNTDNVEVFYKANVDIMAVITNEAGKTVTDEADLKAGNYKIQYQLVKAGTTDKVSSSSQLLGDVKYKATVKNNGKIIKKNSNGVYTIKDGALGINAKATYLDYNTVSTSMNFDVYRDRTIEFNIEEQKDSYVIGNKGVKNSDTPIIVKATMEGKPLTEEQWKQMNAMPVFKGTETEDAKHKGLTILYGFLWKQAEPCQFKIEKGDNIGEYRVYPITQDGTVEKGEYTNTKAKLTYKQVIGKESWTGEAETVVKFVDKRIPTGPIIKLIGLILLLILLLGYTPLFKKRLPRGLKKSPQLIGNPTARTGKKIEDRGHFSKQKSTVYLPYVAEKGSIRFAPKGTPGVSGIRIKATGNNKFKITNAQSFVGKPVKFSGLAMDPAIFKKEYGSSLYIETVTATYRYKCSLNA